MSSLASLDIRPSCATQVVCSICEGESKRSFDKNGILIYDCVACGHRFAHITEQESHVDTVYSDEYFSGGGAGYSDYVRESRLLFQHGKRYGKLLNRFTPAGRLLDVGAAAGFILQGLCSEGWTGRGVEPNTAMARYAAVHLGLDVVNCPFEMFPDDEPFDAISLIQVMAHFLDPKVAVDTVQRLLKPGGVCVVETWNVQSLSARLFGHAWHEYSPPSVVQWFSPNTLASLFESAGMKLIRTGRPAKWIELGHAKSLLQHKAAESLVARCLAGCLTLVPEKLAVPYPSEDLFWSVFRKE